MPGSTVSVDVSRSIRGRFDGKPQTCSIARHQEGSATLTFRLDSIEDVDDDISGLSVRAVATPRRRCLNVGVAKKTHAHV
jgi:hypothetical protein